jgi:sulfonate transport system substrate-binding protein
MMTRGGRRAGVARAIGAPLAVALALSSAGCASSESRARGSADVLRLGLSPTLNQAPGHVALATGRLSETLAPTRVEVTAFNSGKDTALALLAGELDAAYMGPWPAASLFLRSGRFAVVAGATVGGASLVVGRTSHIAQARDLRGRKVAVPGVSNTQDVALRAWLQDNGLRAGDQGGDVAVVEVDNPAVARLLRDGDVDAAWMPEPYPTYLEARGIADVLVDEAALWPDGEFLTSNLVVSTVYMDAHPDLVHRLVQAHVATVRFMQAQPERAEQLALRRLLAAGAPALGRDVLARAWDKLTFTWEPMPSSMVRVVENAHRVGLLAEPPEGILGIYRLDDLDEVLEERGLPAVRVP